MNTGQCRSLCCHVLTLLNVSVLTCLPIFAAASTPAKVLDELSVPRGASLKIVSYNAIHNGVPQAVATISSPHSIDTVIDFYRHHWAQGSDQLLPGYLESELPNWRLISRLTDGYSIVLQLNRQQDQQGANGFVSVRALNAPVKFPDHGPFSNLDLLSSNHSVDGADVSSLHVYASPQSVAQTHDTYKRRLVLKGWTVLSDTRQSNAVAMILSRAQSRLELTFMTSQEYASVLVVHRVTSQ